MPILFYFIAWVAVSFTQVVIVHRLAILGIYPDILTAVIVLIALKHGRMAGVWFGFAFAFSVDLLDPSKLGWMTLLTALLGYAVGVIRDTIYIENPWFEATMVLLATFIYHLLYRFLPSPQFFIDNSLRMLSDSIFIAIYTVAVTSIVIWLLRRRPQLKEVL